MTPAGKQRTLTDYMRDSQTDPFLVLGKAKTPGWQYRDFYPMPRRLWLELIELLGSRNVRLVAWNIEQLPPAEPCRAQIEISSAGQQAWNAYLGVRQ